MRAFLYKPKYKYAVTILLILLALYICFIAEKNFITLQALDLHIVQ